MSTPQTFQGMTLKGFTAPLQLSQFKLIAFDMDSTLINIECVDEIADAAGRKAYEGDGMTTDGERRESPALARQFADYDALIADETFPDWCNALYKPMLEAPWRSLSSEEARS